MQVGLLSKTRVFHAVGIIGCCALAMAGCGKKEGDQAVTGQVVARVGDQPITVQELDNEFRWANVPQDKQKDPEVIKRVLGELVARKFILTQAVNAKLDREPGVLLDLLRVREQVLATAYLNRKISAKPPGKTEVDRYIADNPTKFAKRRALMVEQIGFALGPNAQSVIDANKFAKTLEEVDQQLGSMGVVRNRSSNTLSSGDLPQDLLNKMEEGLKGDEVFFVRSGTNGVFFKLISEEPRPLEGEAAVNLARQLMRAEALKAEAGLATVTATMEAQYNAEYTPIMRSGTGDPGAGTKN